ncbi:MAG: lysozyme [Acidobacteria bacterium]|mgnify:CR=1 FL=1|nr:MAG: lysozyme [Acidobacteriota bacterium]
MEIATFIKIARATAQAHRLPEELVCAVADHESGGWNPWAVRYEAEFERKYVPVNPAKQPTEHYARAFSYGLMQIMGQTARELGFIGAYLTELCDPGIGLEFGCRKLRRCIDAHPGDTRAALLAYNGGGNPKYPDLVLALVPKYAASVDVNKQAGAK